MQKANQEYKFEFERGITNKSFKEWLNDKKKKYNVNAGDDKPKKELKDFPISFIALPILFGLIFYALYKSKG